MIKHYWDEYINIIIDNKELDRITKFHQSILKIENPDDYIKSSLQNSKKSFDHVIYSDIILKKYHKNELPSTLQIIFSELQKIYLDHTFILSMPVLSVYSEGYALERGHYTFNFTDNILIKYSNIKVEKSQKITLSYFMNIERCLALFKSSGYIEGLLQIGYISQRTNEKMKKNNLHTYEIFEILQKHTNNLNLNLRKQFAIKIYSLNLDT